MRKIVCVLRSGGQYTPEHVYLLRDQLIDWSLDHHLVCLTDMEVGEGIFCVPLKYPQLEGWWSKLELASPIIPGDFLYIDLDTMIVGDISDIVNAPDLTLLRDFYYPDRIASGLMLLTEKERFALWEKFIKTPQDYIRSAHHSGEYVSTGDQYVFDLFWRKTAKRWQDVLPKQVISYKVHCQATGTYPRGTRIICFHGEPKPWDVTVVPEPEPPIIDGPGPHDEP